MASELPITCKPTRWFFSRAVAIFLMFAVFAVLFYVDGSTGYREKNLIFYIHRSFEQAASQFAELDKQQSLTPEIWQAYARKQSVKFPDDTYVLPADLKQPMPWPAILCDYERIRPLHWNKLWLEYSAQNGYPAEPSEEPYDRRKINEQWVVFYFCIALCTINAFILIRTARRSISADEQAVTGPDGKRIPYGDLKLLDLRKWDTKGLAFAHYEGASGKGRIRIDGLTYGGFKKAQGEPAETLMQRLRQHFSGELIEYTTATIEEPAETP